MSSTRQAEVRRETKETKIFLRLDLDQVTLGIAEVMGVRHPANHRHMGPAAAPQLSHDGAAHAQHDARLDAQQQHPQRAATDGSGQHVLGPPRRRRVTADQFVRALRRAHQIAREVLVIAARDRERREPGLRVLGSSRAAEIDALHFHLNAKYGLQGADPVNGPVNPIVCEKNTISAKALRAILISKSFLLKF